MRSQKYKNNRAFSEDQIVIEAISCRGEGILDNIVSLFNLYLDDSKIPERRDDIHILS